MLITSVNDAIVHGIPTAYRLRDGDLLSIDFGAELGGWVGDSALSFVVGRPRAEDLRLIETAERALAAGIEAAVVGNRIGDIAHAVGSVCRAAGYGIPQGFGGHGVGRRMHEDPEVPNEGRPGRGLPLRPGMVLAIEPMVIASGRDGHHAAPPTAGRCAPTTAAEQPTWNTRSPSRMRAPPHPHGPLTPPSTPGPTPRLHMPTGTTRDIVGMSGPTPGYPAPERLSEGTERHDQRLLRPGG
ncbi:hypothetical protein GCM10020256_09980 [Streptomyces thermocoprophilus]